MTKERKRRNSKFKKKNIIQNAKQANDNKSKLKMYHPPTMDPKKKKKKLKILKQFNKK